jgi:FMN phosphatase YigB (HAD superfamily)
MTARIRLVTFDALYTLIRPRRPIHVQYSEVFERYVNPQRRVDPDEIKRSFKIALREVQRERPVYGPGLKEARVEDWWREVIRRTGVGAGLDAGGEWLDAI